VHGADMFDRRAEISFQNQLVFRELKAQGRFFNCINFSVASCGMLLQVIHHCPIQCFCHCGVTSLVGITQIVSAWRSSHPNRSQKTAIHTHASQTSFKLIAWVR